MRDIDAVRQNTGNEARVPGSTIYPCFDEAWRVHRVKRRVPCPRYRPWGAAKLRMAPNALIRSRY